MKGLRIETYVGSIVDPELGAHAIVNASNPNLGLGTGVSGAIRDACGGVAFQSEVRRAWSDEFDEPLQADDCLVTGAGSARGFRWVLHVPSVDYRHPDPETGRPSGPSRVQACTRAALREAAELAREHGLVGEMVIGMPLIGARHGGLGEVAAASAIVNAISNFNDRAVLRAIRFAVLREHLGNLVVNAANRFGVPFFP